MSSSVPFTGLRTGIAFATTKNPGKQAEDPNHTNRDTGIVHVMLVNRCNAGGVEGDARKSEENEAN